MRGLPCSPIHQKDIAPKTAMAVSAAALVLKACRTSVQTMGYLKEETVDLVYLDPPFDSAQNYNAFFQEKDGTAAALDGRP